VQGYQHLVLQPPGLIGKVNVTVDQPGEYGGPTEVDHLRSAIATLAAGPTAVIRSPRMSTT
jgi:hypothetical protein